MMRYYWETMDAMVAPVVVIDRLKAAGFTDVKRHCMAGIFSEYSARKPE
jgi:demethylmenaquinone methyltransferase/2-methoxy-6-polyprenyl-1,4-benzoquinol methylase